MKLRNSEGLLPSLFLRIDEAEQTSDVRQGTSFAVYRADILRNIRWILNSSARPSKSPISDFPEAMHSALNFGIPPYSGKVGTSLNARLFANAVREAILRYETRILTDSLEVEPVLESRIQGNQLSFHISGSIWCEPLPERFSLETSIDASTGEWDFST